MEGGPPNFPRGFTCPVVLRNQIQDVSHPFIYGVLTLLDAPFQDASTLGVRRSRQDRIPARLGPITPTAQRIRARDMLSV